MIIMTACVTLSHEHDYTFVSQRTFPSSSSSLFTHLILSHHDFDTWAWHSYTATTEWLRNSYSFSPFRHRRRCRCCTM